MIRIENLKKHYGDFSLDISMDLPSGRVSGLVGRNGAGKTTTIKSILGLIRPDGGSVKVFGKEASELDIGDREKIGVALSDSAFSSYLDARSVMKIMKQMYPLFDEGRFETLCSSFDLPLNRQIRTFSTGMKAKLRVLAAICHKAQLLIMDEPTSGLDVEARNEILDILRDYLARDEECSILISSHISSDLEGLCDDIWLIDEGKIILHEDTDRLLSSYGVLKVAEDAYESIDKRYILAEKKEKFGYSLFTDEKQYYAENYPGLVIDSGGIDDLILIMAKGERR